jgi:hypothetical protein
LDALSDLFLILNDQIANFTLGAYVTEVHIIVRDRKLNLGQQCRPNWTPSKRSMEEPAGNG